MKQQGLFHLSWYNVFKQKPSVKSYVDSQLFSTQKNTSCSDTEYLRDKLTLND